jgi:hypothetical protein
MREPSTVLEGKVRLKDVSADAPTGWKKADTKPK